MRRGVLAIAIAVLVAVLTTGPGPAPTGAQEPPPAEAEAPLLVGGTRNFLGTGNLLGGAGSPFPREAVYLSVNPYCTSRSNGDRYQSGYIGGLNQPGTCSGAPNPDHRPAGYHYTVEVPEARAADVQVWLWDARYSEATVTRPDGSTEAPIDTYRQMGGEPFSFSLLAPDGTPADDTDNPVICSRTFTPTTPFEGTFLGSARWNLLPCPITPSDPAGRYLVRVQNGGAATTPRGDGSNSFGIVAARADHGSDPASVLCDSLVDATCPRVAGAGGHSIRADANTPVVDFPLVEVGEDEQGRRLSIDLFDPGEGGTYIEVLRPATATTWVPATFGWRDDGGGAAAGISRLSVTNNRFNDRLVRISVDLTGYVPPPGNEQWKVRYVFAEGAVTDRTTWDVRLTDPGPSPITGVVRTTTSAVEGATAWLVRVGDAWPGASTTTGPAGRFLFPSVPNGQYQVYVSPPPGSPLIGRWIGGTGTDRAAAMSWTVTGDGSTIDTPPTTLVAEATLSGTVTSSFVPVAGARVLVFGLGESWVPRATTTAGPDGSWTVGLVAGTYEVLVQPPEGPSVWAPGTPTRADGTPVEVTAGEHAEVEVDLAATRAVQGDVLDPDGTGVAGVRIALYRPGAWLPTRKGGSRSDGTFAILDVPDGTYQVQFLPPEGSGLRSTWYRHEVRGASTTITVTRGVTVRNVWQTLSPA